MAIPTSDTGRRSAVHRLTFYALRSLFRILPVRQGTRDSIRAWFLDRFPNVRPDPSKGLHRAQSLRRATVHSGGRALGYVDRHDAPLPRPLPATLVTFYLPQFHSIPENDKWWGKGFTEWTNVSRALPQFEGHAQPRLPGDLGFYDLANPHTMRSQAELAASYGIGAFCFYYYWFSGKTLLDGPLLNWLDDRSITLQFCLCWANENWSRRWDGRENDILIAQRHGAEDDLSFIANIAPYLRDTRYLRVDGKPLLLVYRPQLLPDPKGTANRWRQWCRANGIGEIHLAYVQSFERPDPRDLDFDSAVEFPPNMSKATDVTSSRRLINPGYRGQALDWRDLAESHISRPAPPYPLFPGVNCGWDNEPRRAGAGRSFVHSTPNIYREWLLSAIAKGRSIAPPQQKLVFINAWNEWAEGAVLEPDSRLGYAWLQATRSALGSTAGRAGAGSRAGSSICVVLHAWHLEPLPEILDAISACDLGARLVITTAHEKEPGIRRLLDQTRTTATILTQENRGRDVLPFLRALYPLLEDGTSLVLKLHAKKSAHRSNGDEWRRSMIGTLLNPNDVNALVTAFEENRKLGLLVPEPHLLPLDEYMGANRTNVEYLKRRLGLDETPGRQHQFPSGSMYWARLDALRAILDAHLDEFEFEPEEGQTDGTFAHAIERIVAEAVRHRGYEVASWPGHERGKHADSTRRYPYADRGLT